MPSLALVAYLGFGCISFASGFLPCRQISTTNSARLNVKEDVSDAKIQEDIELDEAKFLADMGREIEGIGALASKDSGALDSTILDATTSWSATDESKQDDDVYSRAIARMEAMAQESIKKNHVDTTRMEDFAKLEVSDDKSKRTSAGNGPLIAFSLLGAAVTVGMAVSAPETITSIDLSTFGLPAADISGFNVDLSSLNIPSINPDLMLQVSGQVDVMKESLASVKDSLLGQTEGIRTSLPVVMDSLGSQVRAVTDALPGQVQATADSLMAQVDPIKDNIISYVNELRDSTLPTVKTSVLAQANAVQSSIPSLDDIQSTASGTLRNVQYFVGPMISEATEYGVAQLGAAQESVRSIQDDLVGKSNEIAQGLPAAQDAMLAQVDTVQNMIQSKAASVDVSTMMPAIDIDIDSMIEQAKMSGDAMLDQVSSAAADAQVAIQSKVTSIDIDSMIEQAKISGDAILDQVSTAAADAQVAIQSKVTSIDIDSMIEQVKMSSDTAISQMSTVFLAQANAVQSSIPSVDDIQSTASGTLRNMQYFVGPMISEATEYGVAQLGAAQESVRSIQDDLVGKSNEIAQGLPAAQDAMLAQVDTVQNMIQSKADSVDVSTMMPAIDIDIDSMIVQAKMSGDAMLDQVSSAAADAQVAIQSKVSSIDIDSMIEQAKMSSDIAISQMSAAVASLQMPEVDTAILADRVKTMQEAVSFKVSNIEIPSVQLPTGNLNLDGLSKLAQDAVKDTTAGGASDLKTMLLEDPSLI